MLPEGNITKSLTSVQAQQLEPMLREFQSKDYTLRGMADELTRRKVPTPRGGTWHPQLVKRTLERLALTA
jgi:hypothetical protein